MHGRFFSRGVLLPLLAIAACGGEEPIGPGQSVATSGAVEVFIATGGPDVDPDGYTLQVGADVEFRVAVNDTARVANVPVGEIQVSLDAVSTNCGVGPSRQQVITVDSERVSRLSFTVTCRPSSSLMLVVSSVGSFLRPLTYVGELEDIEYDLLPTVRRFSDTVTIGGVGAGSKAVTLRGLSNNCQVQGQNPQMVEILRDLPATVTFVVQCQARLRDQILFGASLPGDYVRVYAVNAADGDGLVRVASATEGSVSPDGSTVALYRTHAHGISLLDLATGVLADIDTQAPPSEPDWSPDGQRLVFTMNSDVYVMNADGSGLSNLTNHPALDRSPAWSPDGTKIAFRSHRDGPVGNGEIYVMNADGTQPVNLTNTLAWDGNPSWSPDGSQIVFASDRNPATDSRTIHIMTANGSSPTQVTDPTTQSFEHEPSWSPDGGRIAYVALGGGLRLIGPDGLSEIQLIPSGIFELGPSHPSWSGP